MRCILIPLFFSKGSQWQKKYILGFTKTEVSVFYRALIHLNDQGIHGLSGKCLNFITFSQPTKKFDLAGECTVRQKPDGDKLGTFSLKEKKEYKYGEEKHL